MKRQLLSSVYGAITEVLIVFPGIPTKASVAEYQAITDTFHPKGIVHRFQQDAPGCDLRVTRVEYRGDLLDTNEVEDFLRAFPKTSGVADSDNAGREDAKLGGYRAIQDIAAHVNLTELLHRWKAELEEIERHAYQTTVLDQRPAHPRLRYRRWAQDPFVTMQAEGAIVLLQSYYTHSLADYLLPLQLAEQPGRDIFLKPTQLYLEGGNVLCSRDHAFVGADLIVQNCNLHHWEEERVQQELLRVLGVDKLTVVGYPMMRPKWRATQDEPPTRQPLFHIDLFFTLGGLDPATGAEIVWIADPSLTLGLLKEAQASDPKVKLPVEDLNLDSRLREVEMQQVYANDRKEFMHSNAATDADGSQESHSGYRLIPLPVYWREGVIYSYNNGLIEVTATRRVAYLPTYQCLQDDEQLNATFAVLEKEVVRRFAEAGFEVEWIRSGLFFRIVSSHGGSLHCVTKVLRRGE